MTRWILIGIALLGVGGAFAIATLQRNGAEAAAAAESIQRGRYLVKIGGCNDCHTPGYLAKAGEVPEDRWLIGDSPRLQRAVGHDLSDKSSSLLADHERR